MYVVAGVSGNTGAVVADTLLSAGKPVTVLARSAEKGARWGAKGAKVSLVSLEDTPSLSHVLSKAEGAYLLIPPNHAAADFIEDRRGVVRSVARAVEQSGIPHVVFLSSVGAHQESGTGPIQVPRLGELALGAVTPNLTILRPAYFLENWASVLPAVEGQGVLYSFLTPGKKVAMIATKDIGTIAAESLLERARGRRVKELAGPVDYAPEEIAQVLTDTLGREIRLQTLPAEAVQPALTQVGISADVARLMEEMIVGINTGIVDYERCGEFHRGTTRADAVFRGLLRM